MSKTYIKDSEFLLNKLQAESNSIEKRSLEKKLWEMLKACGTPIMSEKKGTYDVTFLYHSPIANEVKLDCHDLRDRMLDKNGQPRKFIKEPGTDTFILTINDIPENAFIAYKIIAELEGATKIDVDLRNPHALVINQYDTLAKKYMPNTVSYIPLPKMEIPAWLKKQASKLPNRTIINLPVTKTDIFSERKVWVYKPNDFNAKDGKVIFMLDGKEFCSILTPFIDAIRQEQNNPFVNTAFVFIEFGKDEYKWPARVFEYYKKTTAFAEFLANEIIPKFGLEILGVKNQQNILLAAHSLAAYPMLEILDKYPKKIGAVFLFSPEILCEQYLPIHKKALQSHKKIPIYIQVGQLEDAIPPESIQGLGKGRQEKLNQSRLDANFAFHQKLAAKGYDVSELIIHPAGHSEIHVFDGLMRAMHHLKAGFSIAAMVQSAIGKASRANLVEKNAADESKVNHESKPTIKI